MFMIHILNQKFIDFKLIYKYNIDIENFQLHRKVIEGVSIYKNKIFYCHYKKN